MATSTCTAASISRITLRRILCPLDLIENPGDALGYAFKLATAYGAKLIVYHCAKDDSAGTSRAGPELAALKRQLEREVRSKLPMSEGNAGLEWETIVTGGDPVEMIAWESAIRQIDLIVMCSRRRPMRAALLGSTAEALCRIAPCPVLVTHPDVREAGQRGLERILIAYDFSGDSELALANGLSLATEFNSELHLLHVLSARNAAMIEPGSQLAPEVFVEVRRKLRRALPCEADPERGLKLALREGAVYREVLSYAEDRNVDLICMGASGSGYGMHALFGSNSDRVVRQARCPILIARPLRPA